MQMMYRMWAAKLAMPNLVWGTAFPGMLSGVLTQRWIQGLLL